MSRDHASYRTRVQDIRSEARSLIERLRAERLAKSRFAPRPAAAPAPSPAPPSQARIDEWTGGALLLVEAVPVEPKPARKRTPKAAARSAAPWGASPPASPLRVDPPSVQDGEGQEPLPVDEKVTGIAAAPAKPRRKAVKPSSTAPASDVAATAPVAEAAPADEPAALPIEEREPIVIAMAPAPARRSAPRAPKLATKPPRTRAASSAPSVSLLPGIGPGLVWRLEQAGYRTLADIAEARVDEIAERLGAVGKLVKLDRWVAFAKEAGSSGG